MYKGFKKYFLKYLTAKKALKSSSYISGTKIIFRAIKIRI